MLYNVFVLELKLSVNMNLFLMIIFGKFIVCGSKIWKNGIFDDIEIIWLLILIVLGSYLYVNVWIIDYVRCKYVVYWFILGIFVKKIYNGFNCIFFLILCL